MMSYQTFIKFSGLLLAIACSVNAQAAETQISTVPLNTYSAASSTDVKPNVMFILDNSGSMGWEYMPDAASTGFYGPRSSQCNGVYYNPNITYKLPVNADGSTYSNASFTGALPDGFKAATGAFGGNYPVDLSTSFKTDSDSSGQAAYYYSYSGTQLTAAQKNFADSNSTFYKECTSSSGNSPGNGVFTKVVVPEAQKQNFANWYSYYRSRMLMMKSASGIAFKNVSDRFRVGFMTINNETGSADFLNIADFTTANKSTWYDSLYGSKPSGGTPLRDALADAGRMYAGKLTSRNGVDIVDPVQYSCQQNYTILSTDGFWNGDAGMKLNGSTTVGNQDAQLARPYTDGGNSQLQTRTSQLQSQTVTLQPQIKTSQLQSQTVTLQSQIKTSQLQSQTVTLQPQAKTSQLQSQTVTAQAQTSTSTLQIRTATTATAPSIQTRTSSNSGSTWTSWSNVGSCTADNSGADRRQCQVPKSTSSDSGATWTPWAYASSCSTDNSGSTRTQCSGTVILSWSAWANTTSCTAGSTTQCQYTAWTGYVDTPSCTPAARSTGPNYTGPAQQCNTVTTLGTWTNTTSCTDSSTMNCRYLPWTTTWANVASCTPLGQSSGPNYTGPATQCNTVTVLGPWTNAASCTDSSSMNCQYLPWSATWTNVGSCTPLGQSSGPNYSVGLASQCNTVEVLGAWANTASCTDTSTMNCQYLSWSATWTNVASCTAVAQSTGPNYTGPAAQCNTATVLGSWTNAASCTASTTQNCQYLGWTGWSNAATCTDTSRSAGPSYTVGVARECQTIPTTGTSDTLADVAAYYYNTDLRSPTVADGTGTCTGPTGNDLCGNNVPASGDDVAVTQHMTTFTLGLGVRGRMVYSPTYKTDTSGDYFDVAKGNIADPATGKCSWQASGKCNWPTPGSDQIENVDDLWHAAVNGHGTYFSATDPDTLANGLNSALKAIINTPRPGTAAAAASSNPNVSSSDNYVFSSSYKSVEWYGELIRQRIDAQTGVLSGQNWSAMKLLDCATTSWQPNTNYVVGRVYKQGTTCYSVTKNYVSGTTFNDASVDTTNAVVVNEDETATTKVPVTPLTTRTIYTKGASGFVPFTWSSLVDAGLDNYFKKAHIAYVSADVGLSQFCTGDPACLSATAQDNNTIATGGAAGEALVNFLRGDRGYEVGSGAAAYFRQRVHVLGDIVASEARYVKAPLFNYSDAGYGDFKTLKKNRAGVVYVGANDGMMHAIDATTGQELWAYVPSMVLPNLYKLADKNYSTQHQYYVDGTPETGDICPTAPATACTSSTWKTILVGGLNRGGKGYYAIDVTNPASPVLLWEFTDTNLGYSYGNPRITKLRDGTWVVMFAAGYNNADGKGRLFVLNAYTGAKITGVSDIHTGVGSSADPSGLARISAHVRNPMTDNTVQAVYGGDILGNLWRFDVNGDIGASGREAHLLVTFKDDDGNVQPVTVKPLEATINNKPVVFVGTGRYLGTGDVSSTRSQSFYAVRDRLDTTTLANPRAGGSGFVEQVLTSDTCPDNAPTSVCIPGQVVRTVTSNPVNWSTANGWFIDFLTGGERSVTDPALGLGTLLFTSITPSSASVNACGSPSGAGASYLYSLDYLTGGAVQGTFGVGGVSLGDGIVTRPVMIKLATGKVVALIRASGGSVDVDPTSGLESTDNGRTLAPPIKIKGELSGTTRRVSWRELSTQ